jgi:hypothetical protein
MADMLVLVFSFVAALANRVSSGYNGSYREYVVPTASWVAVHASAVAAAAPVVGDERHHHNTTTTTTRTGLGNSPSQREARTAPNPHTAADDTPVGETVNTLPFTPRSSNSSLAASENSTAHGKSE